MGTVESNHVEQNGVCVDTEVERRDDVTFVMVTVRNERSTPQRVELRSTFDGPIWTPLNGDVPTPEWADGNWEGTVLPNQRRGMGFATPADPVSDPVELVETTRTTSQTDTGSTERILAELEEWSPPAQLTLDTQ